MDDQFKELREWMMERDVSLRKHIDERFTHIDQRLTQIDGQFTHIDERLTQIDERFTQIDERFTQIDERFVEMHDYTDERSRDIETRLLTEFHKWAVRIESTIKPLPIRTASLEERVALIEERLKGIDRPLF